MREGMERLISQYGLSNKFDVVKTASVTEALEENLEILKNVKVVFPLFFSVEFILMSAILF